MNKLLFHNIPLGASGENIPQAKVASARTSRETVQPGGTAMRLISGGWRPEAFCSIRRRSRRYAIISGRC
ncbi:hypothetical protein ACFSQ7_49800 [Paenibacillus rhizoplanae]